MVPGLGHPLYPNSDVRAAALAERLPPDALMRKLAACALDATGALPNIDFALAVLVRAAGLRRHAPFALFLLGRSVEWAVHAVAQARDGTLFRPRACHEGQQLEGDGTLPGSSLQA